MNAANRWLVLVGAAALVSACGVPDKGPWMMPGADCLSCHTPGGEAGHKQWTVGGTIFDSSGNAVSDAQIVIKDASGRAVTLTSNGGGNFYTGESLAEPFQEVAVVYNGKQLNMPMSSDMPATGACNSCHTPGGKAGAEIKVPTP